MQVMPDNSFQIFVTPSEKSSTLTPNFQDSLPDTGNLVTVKCQCEFGKKYDVKLVVKHHKKTLEALCKGGFLDRNKKIREKFGSVLAEKSWKDHTTTFAIDEVMLRQETILLPPKERETSLTIMSPVTPILKLVLTSTPPSKSCTCPFFKVTANTTSNPYILTL